MIVWNKRTEIAQEPCHWVSQHNFRVEFALLSERIDFSTGMKLLRKLPVERLADFQGALGGADAADLHRDLARHLSVLVRRGHSSSRAFARASP